MRVYTYSEARQNLSELLNCAENEEVVIKRRDGKTFTVIAKPISSSPFDVPGINVKASTQDILDAISETRKP
jgi:hypothetical protein